MSALLALAACCLILLWLTAADPGLAAAPLWAGAAACALAAWSLWPPRTDFGSFERAFWAHVAVHREHDVRD